MILFSIFGAGATTIDTLLIKYVVDQLMLSENVGKVIPIIVCGIFTSAILSIFNCWIKQKIEYKNLELINFFELRISKKIMSLKYEDIDNPDILEKKDKALFPVRNQNAIAVFLDNIVNIMQSVFSLISICVILFTLDIWLMLIIFMVILIDIWIFSRIQKAEYEFFQVIIEDNRELNYYKSITTDFKYAKDIRLFGFSSFISSKINDYIDISIERFAHANKKVGRFNSYSAILGVLRKSIVYAYVAFKVWVRSIGIGSFTMYVYAVTNFSDHFSKVFINIIEMKQYCKFLYPYFMFEKMESMEDTFGEQKMDESFEIGFDNVSFKYPNQKEYALKNVSFFIKKNEVVSLVGINGSGKTTLVKLMCGLYKPTEGKITINGVNLSDYGYSEFVNKLAIVFQDYKIFGTTIGENIFFEHSISRDKLFEVLKQVSLLDFVKNLKNAEDTPITKMFSQEGIELSGGMEQRLAIARALAKDFNVVILDEPTAALDPIKENQILNDMKNITRNKTAIFVSHSMSSCLWVDKIIVLKDGCVEEIGKHKELLGRNGEYEKLFSAQASFYV